MRVRINARRVRAGAGLWRRSLSVLAGRPGLGLWAAAIVGAAAVLIAGACWTTLARYEWVSPLGLFWIVVPGAGLCWVGALWALQTGWKGGLAEVSILGAAIAVQSVLAIVHGLTAPGVLFGPTHVLTTAVLLANPLAMAAALPLLMPRLRLSIWAARHVRIWTAAWVSGSAGLAAWFVIAPNVVPPTVGGSAFAVALTIPTVAAALLISLRELRLYWLGRRRACLIAAIGIGLLGVSGLVWLGDPPFSIAWWAAHALDVSGVLGVAGALIVGYRADQSISDLIAPIVTRDPVVALELGMSPIVHRFVASLATKDAVTRNHVVRVAELAIRSGERAGFRGSQLRYLGLAALLHDIGKLDVPDAILTKPGPLTSAETERMRVHAAVGARILASSQVLAPAAPLVRAHHERIDGTGYPDGLHGAEIPFAAAILAVCDAYDAMAHTRHYRSAMEAQRALAILQEHSGTQWLPHAVEVVVATLADTGHQQNASVLDQVGRVRASQVAFSEADVCLDAVPSAAREALVSG
ncbi:MAG: HD-GYP domain-containing protein [Candidatus Dormibacteria bacterium]